MAGNENTLRAPEDDATKRFWRGLDELTETREYKDFLHQEYPYGDLTGRRPTGGNENLRCDMFEEGPGCRGRGGEATG